MKPGKYAQLRDRMNTVYWKWYWAGRMQEALRLCRAWEAWWDKVAKGKRWDVRTGV